MAVLYILLPATMFRYRNKRILRPEKSPEKERIRDKGRRRKAEMAQVVMAVVEMVVKAVPAFSGLPLGF